MVSWICFKIIQWIWAVGNRRWGNRWKKTGDGFSWVICTGGLLTLCSFCMFLKFSIIS